LNYKIKKYFADYAVIQMTNYCIMFFNRPITTCEQPITENRDSGDWPVIGGAGNDSYSGVKN